MGMQPPQAPQAAQTQSPCSAQAHTLEQSRVRLGGSGLPTPTPTPTCTPHPPLSSGSTGRSEPPWGMDLGSHSRASPEGASCPDPHSNAGHKWTQWPQKHTDLPLRFIQPRLPCCPWEAWAPPDHSSGTPHTGATNTAHRKKISPRSPGPGPALLPLLPAPDLGALPLPLTHRLGSCSHTVQRETGTTWHSGHCRFLLRLLPVPLCSLPPPSFRAAPCAAPPCSPHPGDIRSCSPHHGETRTCLQPFLSRCSCRPPRQPWGPVPAVPTLVSTQNPVPPSRHPH